jgi:hypothetical protein
MNPGEQPASGGLGDQPIQRRPPAHCRQQPNYAWTSFDG